MGQTAAVTATAMPVIAQNAAKSLKPERVGKPAQHFVSAKLGRPNDCDVPGKLAHALE